MAQVEVPTHDDTHCDALSAPLESPSQGTGKSMMHAVIDSLSQEAQEIWRRGGGEALLEDGKRTAEHDAHMSTFTSKLVAEALHQMLNDYTEDCAAPHPDPKVGDEVDTLTADNGNSEGEQHHTMTETLTPERQASITEHLAEVRKKDSPTDDDVLGQAALIYAQQIQDMLVTANFRPEKKQHVLAAVNQYFDTMSSWPAPNVASAEIQDGMLYGNLYPHVPPVKLRCVVDDFVSNEECRDVCGYCVRGMHCMFRRGGQTSLAVTPKMLERRVDHNASELICSLVERTRLRIVKDFLLEEDATGGQVLFESGALLTRLQAEWERDMWEITGLDAGGEHPYWNAHVDKANVASYDYAALLYLNTQGQHFEGGDFAFIDAEEDCLVRPRRGRLLTFTAGPENLHQVQRVRAGTRFVLAMWFTLSEAHRRKDD